VTKEPKSEWVIRQKGRSDNQTRASKGFPYPELQSLDNRFRSTHRPNLPT
jgi:hypothetical protein